MLLAVHEERLLNSDPKWANNGLAGCCSRATARSLTMIISPCLPEINGLLGKCAWKRALGRHLRMLLLGIFHHRGRMSAQQVASAIVGQSCHRAAVGRFLKRHGQHLRRINARAWQRLLEVA